MRLYKRNIRNIQRDKFLSISCTFVICFRLLIEIQIMMTEYQPARNGVCYVSHQLLWSPRTWSLSNQTKYFRIAQMQFNRRVDSRFASSQWETTLLCNDVSHWLGASLESAMNRMSIRAYHAWYKFVTLSMLPKSDTSLFDQLLWYHIFQKCTRTRNLC